MEVLRVIFYYIHIILILNIFALPLALLITDMISSIRILSRHRKKKKDNYNKGIFSWAHYSPCKVWSYVGLSKYAFIMNLGILAFSLAQAFIFYGVFNTVIFNLANLHLSFWGPLIKYGLTVLMSLSVLSLIGVTIFKMEPISSNTSDSPNTVNKRAFSKHFKFSHGLIHLIFAIMALSLQPIILIVIYKFVNSYIIGKTLYILSSLHLFLFGILAILWLCEKIFTHPRCKEYFKKLYFYNINNKINPTSLISCLIAIIEKILIVLLSAELLLLIY